MVPPHAGDFVEERLQRVRIGINTEHGKIRADEAHGEPRESQRDEKEHRQRERRGGAHQDGIVLPCAPQRQRRLQHGKREGKDQRIMGKLGDHGLP
jgi:hypothetical protein